MLMTIQRLPDRVTVRKGGETHPLTQADGVFRDHSYSLIFQSDSKSGGIQVTLEAHDAASYVILRWEGNFPRGTRFLSDAFERTYGEQEWRGMVAQRMMPWYFLASTGEQGQTCGYGVQVRPNAIALWQCDPKGVTLWLDVRCGAQPVQPGREPLELATIVQLQSQKDESPFALHQRFCHVMCSDPVLPDNVVYGSNNWYYAYGNFSRADIEADTATVARLTAGLENRPYMVIDDGWQEFTTERICAGGPYVRGGLRMGDMGELARSMKAQGVRPGIWVRPTLNHDRQIPGSWRLERDWDVLDPTVPAVRDYIGGIIERLTGEWGFELVKYDFSTFDLLGKWGFEVDIALTSPGWAFKDRTMTTAQAVKALYKTILDHANGAVLIGCNCIGHLGAGLFHIHRSGDDTSGRNWERTRKMGVNSLAFRLPQHKAFFDVDADCVGITADVPWERTREWLKMLSMSGTPLFCSITPGLLDERQEAEVMQAFARGSLQADVAEPLDCLETTCPDRWRINGEEVSFDLFEPDGVAMIGPDGELVN